MTEKEKLTLQLIAILAKRLGEVLDADPDFDGWDTAFKTSVLNDEPRGNLNFNHEISPELLAAGLEEALATISPKLSRTSAQIKPS